jgi:hypothetical protein
MKWHVGDIISLPANQSTDLFQIISIPDSQNIELINMTWDTNASFTTAFVDAYGSLITSGAVNPNNPGTPIPLSGGCLLAILGIR